MTTQEELIERYSQKSKHSNYQVLPKILEPILGQEQLEVTTRYENERLDYILKNVDVRDKTVLDIGGNTGFFAFELLAAGAKSAHMYEGNTEHCEFVKLAASAVGLDNLSVTNDYYSFSDQESLKYDVVLLLNVLHHLGDDYGDGNIDIVTAKTKMLDQLNSMRSVTDTLVFQLGFNWHGNTETGLFEAGTKKEMIDYITEGVGEYWKVSSIGIATKQESKVIYQDLNDNNIERDDSMGEFLNRPLFILRAV